MELEIFKQNGWAIRAIEKDGEPWFVARDIANALGYEDPSDATRRHCKKVNKISQQGATKCSPPINILVIPEADVYRLIMRSQLQDAEKFQDWVVEEVLPSIRKTGSYSVTTPKNFAEALRLAADQAEQIESLEKQKLIDSPKVEFANIVEGSEDCLNIGEFAKLSGKIGRNTLFKALRDEGILMSSNVPFQRYVTAGYFSLTEKETQGGLKSITLVTGKGQLWLSKKIDLWA